MKMGKILRYIEVLLKEKKSRYDYDQNDKKKRKTKVIVTELLRYKKPAIKTLAMTKQKKKLMIKTMTLMPKLASSVSRCFSTESRAGNICHKSMDILRAVVV